MYHVLNESNAFDGIYYLDVYTDRSGVNASSTKGNVRSTIQNWLNSSSGPNDTIFIYFSSHGLGYHNDEARLSGDETPWFDDDGDGLPTFRNGADNLDNNQGSVANMTYIDWLLGDIDENGIVAR